MLQAKHIDGNIKREYAFLCIKFIISTGLASRQNPLNLGGVSDLVNPLFSHAEYVRRASDILDDQSIKHVVVCAASKAGHDAVYGMASRGK